MARCRSCGAEVVWAIVKESGKRIPLDTPPVDGGSYAFVGMREDATYGSSILVRPMRGDQLLLADDARDPMKRYMPHHATCPDAEEWRERHAS